MAISHELSGEIATALLAAKGQSPRELEDLKEIILVVHSTLQQMSDDAQLAHADRLNSQAAASEIAKGKAASS
jgi:hypothetical protein